MNQASPGSWRTPLRSLYHVSLYDCGVLRSPRLCLESLFVDCSLGCTAVNGRLHCFGSQVQRGLWREVALDFERAPCYAAPRCSEGPGVMPSRISGGYHVTLRLRLHSEPAVLYRIVSFCCLIPERFMCTLYRLPVRAAHAATSWAQQIWFQL